MKDPRDERMQALRRTFFTLLAGSGCSEPEALTVLAASTAELFIKTDGSYVAYMKFADCAWQAMKEELEREENE